MRFWRIIQLWLRKRFTIADPRVARAKWRFDLGYSGCETCKACDDTNVTTCRTCKGKAWLFWDLENGKRVYH